MNGIPESVKTNAPYYRDEIRAARNRAMDDAEDFHDLLFAFERLGSALLEAAGTLGDYAEKLTKLAENSSLACEIPLKWRDWHVPAAQLVTIVRQTRNDALHQGAVARHLTNSGIQLAIILEDALMVNATTVGEMMHRDPACAQLWQPLSFIRQKMLAKSFSFLPVYLGEGEGWHFVSDRALAIYLRSNPQGRNKKLAQTLGDAKKDGLVLVKGHCVNAHDKIADVLDRTVTVPLLVCREGHEGDLVGVLTAFDLL